MVELGLGLWQTADGRVVHITGTMPGAVFCYHGHLEGMKEILTWDKGGSFYGFTPTGLDLIRKIKGAKKEPLGQLKLVKCAKSKSLSIEQLRKRGAFKANLKGVKKT